MAGALAFVAGVPAAAHAQQSGLFPLAPIHRERVPCAMEDPVYRIYRQQYFGYHPTCWRRFPVGWGCPSPEAPNQAEAFRVLPRDQPPGGNEPGDEPGPDRGGAPDEMGPGPGAKPNAGTPAQPGRDALPPLPPSDRSPFDFDNKPGANPTPPAGGNRPASDTPGLGLLQPATGASPSIEPEPPTVPASSGGDSSSTNPVSNPGGDAPLLAVSDPTAPALTTGTDAFGVPLAVPASPAQAPRRQSLLSGLFSGFRRR